MNTSTIATGIIQIVVKGMEAAQAQLDAIPKQLAIPPVQAPVKAAPAGATPAPAGQAAPAAAQPKPAKAAAPAAMAASAVPSPAAIGKVAEEMDKVAASGKKALDIQQHLWDSGKSKQYLSDMVGIEVKQTALTKKEEKYREGLVKQARQQELIGKHGKIGGFAVAGAENLSKGLDAIQPKFEAVGKAASTVGKTAAVGFAAMTGGIIASVKSADPVGFQRMEIAITRIAIQVGRIFIPILRDLTGMLNSVADWFGELTDAQREVALMVTKVALGLLAIVAVGGQLVGLLPLLSAGLGIAAKAFVFMWTSAGGPITLIVAGIALVIAAVAAIGLSVMVASGKTAKFSAFFKRAWDACVAVVMSAKPIFDGIVAWFSDNADGILEAVSGLFNQFLSAMTSIWDSLVTVIMALAPVFKIVIGLVMAFAYIAWAMVLKVVDVFALLLDWLAKIIDAWMGWLEEIYSSQGGMTGIWITLWTAIKDVWGAVMLVWDTFTSFFASSSEGAGGLFGWLSKLGGSIWDGMVSGIKMVTGFLKKMLDGAVFGIEQVVAHLTATAAVIKAIMSNPTEIANIAQIYQDAVEKSTAAQEKARKERNKPPEAMKEEEKKKEEGRFDPMREQKVESFSISEAFKKVQASQLEDPKLAADRERNRIAKSSDEKLSDLLNAVEDIRRGGVLGGLI